MNTEPANTAVAGDLSVSAQIIAFALLVAGEADSVSRMMQSIGRGFVQYMNFTYERRAILRYQFDPGLIDEMRAATHKGIVICSARFKAEFEAMLKRKVEPAKRGRPVKNRDDQRKGEQMSLLAEHK